MMTVKEAREHCATMARSWRETHCLHLRMASLTVRRRGGPAAFWGTARQQARVHLARAVEADRKAIAWERLPPGT